MVSRSILEGGAWPSLLVRKEAQEDSLRRWLKVGYESERDLADAETAHRISIDELLSRFRVLDSVLDEPAGNRWAGNAEEAQYCRKQGED